MEQHILWARQKRGEREKAVRVAATKSTGRREREDFRWNIKRKETNEIIDGSRESIGMNSSWCMRRGRGSRSQMVKTERGIEWIHYCWSCQATQLADVQVEARSCSCGG